MFIQSTENNDSTFSITTLMTFLIHNLERFPFSLLGAKYQYKKEGAIT
jgi:hypothetical protein